MKTVNKRKVWFVVNSNDVLLTFIDDEPKFVDNVWQGKLFCNSLFYNQLKKELEQVQDKSVLKEPQCIVVDFPNANNSGSTDLDYCWLVIDKSNGSIDAFANEETAENYCEMLDDYVIIKQQIKK